MLGTWRRAPGARRGSGGAAAAVEAPETGHKERTEVRLSEEERMLLLQLLYDLRMRYLAAERMP
jgi:hypothetical protein